VGDLEANEVKAPLLRKAATYRATGGHRCQLLLPPAAPGADGSVLAPSIFAPVSTPAFAIREIAFFALGTKAVTHLASRLTFLPSLALDNRARWVHVCSTTPTLDEEEGS
jgi:hypothetical protein